MVSSRLRDGVRNSPLGGGGSSCNSLATEAGSDEVLVRTATIAIVSLIGAMGCGGTTIVYDPSNYAKEFDPRKHEYVIGISDELVVNVWRNGDLSGSALVRPDGVITLPLIGDLKVEGSTPTAVRDEVKRRLSAYVKDETAVVTVAVTGINSYRFTVSGNVAQPGSFSSSNFVSVSQALAMAGGPNRFAASEAIVLMRPSGPGKVRQIPINYGQIVSRERPEQDLMIVAGDTLYVP